MKFLNSLGEAEWRILMQGKSNQTLSFSQESEQACPSLQETTHLKKHLAAL